MDKKYNVFIEGIPGSGKTTMLNALADSLSDYRPYREGDVSPVELAWCAFMDKEQYDRLLFDMPELKNEIESKTVMEEHHYITPYTKIETENLGFYEYAGKYEIYGGKMDATAFRELILQRFRRFQTCGNLFECSFFQNIIEELMLFAVLRDEQIIDFYREILSALDLPKFKLIRLIPRDIEASINTIKCERVNENGEEVWFGLMMNYLIGSPYGKKHDIKDFCDMIAHFKRRIKLEDEVIRLLPSGCCINIESKNYDISDVLRNF